MAASSIALRTTRGAAAQHRDRHLLRKGTSPSSARAVGAASSQGAIVAQGHRAQDVRDANDAEVLCVVRNALAEPMSLRVQCRTPGGLSFLHDTECDLEPGGHMSFVGSISNEVEVWTEFGRLELIQDHGRPQLLPREGTEQATQRTPSLSRGLPPWVLTCVITASPQQRPVVQASETLQDLLGCDPDLREFACLWRAAKMEAAPEESLMALENDSITDEVRLLLQDCEGFDHLRIPYAVFLTQEGGVASAKDGARVHARLDADSTIFEIDAQGAWPPLRLAAPRRGLRAKLRWQLLFPARVIL